MFSVQQAKRGHHGVPAQPSGRRQDPSGDDRHDQGQDEGLLDTSQDQEQGEGGGLLQEAQGHQADRPLARFGRGGDHRRSGRHPGGFEVGISRFCHETFLNLSLP